MEKITKKKFEEMLNADDAASHTPMNWKHGRYHQSKRLYGSYIRSQDPNMFEWLMSEYVAGNSPYLDRYI